MMLCMGVVVAQDSVLVKEITVSQDYNPTVNDAFKMGSTPVVNQPESFTPKFDYSFFNAPLRTDYSIQFLSAQESSPIIKDEKWKENYVKGGAGNYSTLLGEIFYNAYNSDIQNVNLFYSNRSSWGRVRLQDDKRVDAPLFENHGKVDIKRRYRQSVLSSSLLFDRTGYEYYGFNTLEKGETYLDDDNNEVDLDEDRQFIMDLGLEMKLASLTQRRGPKYESSLTFHSVSNEDKFVENTVDLSFLIEQELKEMAFGLDFNTDLGLCSKSDPALLRAYDDETFFGVDLAPFLKWNKKNWDLKLGARFDFYTKDYIQESTISPVLDFNFNIVPKYFTGYVTGRGGIEQNTYAKTVMTNYFIANDIVLVPTKTPVDVDAGIIGHPTKELSLKLGVGYQLIQDQLFYVNELVKEGGSVFLDDDYTNRFQAEYDDNNLLSFHGEVSYNTYKKWSATVKADYYSYNLKNLPEAWNLPEFKIQAFGRYKVTEKITATAKFLFLPERATKVSVSNDIHYLTVVYDLSLGGEYRYKEFLSFFVDVNNALATKYYMYNGYPAQRFNALAGAIFRF